MRREKNKKLKCFSQDFLNRRNKIINLRCIFKVKSFSAGRSSISGQICALGVPRRSMMISSWFISLLPGNNGLWAKSSPRIQPADHMSIAVVWVFEFKRSSGLRYHKVTKKEGEKLITYKIKKAESIQHNLHVLVCSF